jgi:prepilin peptidase CpaA
MTTTSLVLNVLLGLVLAIACTTDLRSRRIPNLLTFTTVLFGLWLNVVFYGFDGLRDSASGLGIALAMLFPLFLLRWMGAGDVKLMMAIGALKGPEFAFYACLWAAVFGAIIALIGLIKARRLTLSLQHMLYSGLMPQTDGSFMTGSWRMPYAPAIALGCVLVLAGVRAIGH